MIATLPPCALMKINLRQPARATLSPISVQARISVSAESVNVPGYSACSLDRPMVCAGRNNTGMSAGIRAITRSRWPWLMKLSVPTGK